MYCPLWKQLYNGSYLWFYIAISYLQLNEYIKAEKISKLIMLKFMRKEISLNIQQLISTMESKYRTKQVGGSYYF
jgi:hypothetical protein